MMPILRDNLGSAKSLTSAWICPTRIPPPPCRNHPGAEDCQYQGMDTAGSISAQCTGCMRPGSHSPRCRNRSSCYAEEQTTSLRSSTQPGPEGWSNPVIWRNPSNDKVIAPRPRQLRAQFCSSEPNDVAIAGCLTEQSAAAAGENLPAALSYSPYPRRR
jgi:hypothetical protein